MIKIRNIIKDKRLIINKGTIIISPSSIEELIDNNLDIYIDKVYIYDNVGIVLMLKDNVVKLIKANYIQIDTDYEDVIRISYSNEIRDDKLLYPKMLILYYIECPNKEKSLYSSFIPNSIGSEKENISLFLMFYAKKLIDSGNIKSEVKEEIKNLMDSLSYEIKEVSPIIKDLYLVSVKNPDSYKKIGINLTDDKKSVYTFSDSVLTINDLYDFIDNL